MGLSSAIHRQVTGFLMAGKGGLPVAHAAWEKLVSRAAAVSLLVGVGMVAAWRHQAGLLHFRALAQLALLLVWLGPVAGALFRGASVVAMARACLRYWIPVGAIAYVYVVLAYAVYGMLFRCLDSAVLGTLVGTAIGGMAILGMIASWGQARALSRDAQGARRTDLDAAARAKIVGLRLSAVVWAGFLAGGLVALAWATGLGDWFFNDVLG